VTNTEHQTSPTTATPDASPTDPGATGTTRTAHLTDHEGSDMPTVRQRDARLLGKGSPARTPDPIGAETRVTRFIPGDPRVDPYLALIRALTRAARPVDAPDAAEILTVLAGHAAYLVDTGVPVADGALLDPALVNRWIRDGLAGLTAGTTANYRSRLARVAAAVHGAPDRPAPLYASDPVRPYDRAGEDGLVRWAAALDGPSGQDLLFAVVVTLGAGLTAAQVGTVRGRDVAGSSADVVTVRVPGLDGSWNPIPVRARYAGVVRDAGTRSGPDRHLFRPGAPGGGGRNGISNLVAAAIRQAGGDLGRVERFTPQRARATWIVRHLDAGTRVDALLRAANVAHLAAFDRYVRYMAPADNAVQTGLALRGAP